MSSRTHRSVPRRHEDGFFTIYVLGLCMCLFFIGGISLDLWRGFTERRSLASIADAAVLVGAAQIDLPAFKASPSVLRLEPGTAKSATIAYINAAAAERDIDLTGTQVTIVNGEVRVQLSTNMNMLLTTILTPNDDYEISVTSAAEPRVAA